MAVKSLEIISKNGIMLRNPATVTPLHIKQCYSHVYFKNIGIEFLYINVSSNISNTRDIQTPRRELKIRRAAEYF